ncbi:hypothetical protein C8R42DRAFT_641631 [Lentinula raphanica]|nr:hypothetical protein C8R42DRAFT_641631 [Lentinula raphanica]
MHPIHGTIRTHRDQIKAKVHQHASEEDLLDDVRDVLICNNELVSSMIGWIGQNLGLNAPEATHPDRGYLLLTLTDILAHLVWEEEDKVEEDLSCYHTRLLELNEEEYDVPPQRNVFPVGERFGTEITGEEEETECDNTEQAPADDVMDVDRVGDIKQQIKDWQAEEKDVLISDKLYKEQLAVASRWNGQLLKIINTVQTDDDIPGILGVIKAMKEVKKNVYTRPAFRRAIKDTGLTNTIEEISSPVFLNRPRNSQALQLELKYRIADQLSDVLDRWLGSALEEIGYNVTKFNNEKALGDFYSRVVSLMIKWCTEKIQTRDGLTSEYAIDLKSFERPLWRVIIKQTVKLRLCKQMASKYAKQLKNCQDCRELPPSLRCTQYLYFPHIMTGLHPDEKEAKLTTLRDELIGCGITMVGSDEQIQPRKPKKDKTKRRRTYNTDMYHPDAIGKTNPLTLQCVQPNEDIVRRCGHQLCLVVDEEDPKTPMSQIVDWDTNVIDFVWFHPFNSETLAVLQDAVVESTGVSALKRGAQFESYSGGTMVPLGSRTASGGRAGDTYTSYAGLDATSEKGLDILFNQAAIADIMRAAAVHAHSKTVDKLEDWCNECDHMGMTGANIYNCTGYMAPIHRDQDTTRGLCTQVLLSADSSQHEFAFCNIEYKYFIATSTNCLWSFHSSDLHGTMLPSKNTVAFLNSHALDPNRAVPSLQPSASTSTGSTSAATGSGRPGRSGPGSRSQPIVAGAEYQGEIRDVQRRMPEGEDNMNYEADYGDANHKQLLTIYRSSTNEDHPDAVVHNGGIQYRVWHESYLSVGHCPPQPVAHFHGLDGTPLT